MKITISQSLKFLTFNELNFVSVAISFFQWNDDFVPIFIVLSPTVPRVARLLTIEISLI